MGGGGGGGGAGGGGGGGGGGEGTPGFLGGVVLPSYPNPHPISVPKKCQFPHPFSDLAFKIHTRFQMQIMSSLLTLVPQQEIP